jgi:hypothetical protein
MSLYLDNLAHAAAPVDYRVEERIALAQVSAILESSLFREDVEMLNIARLGFSVRSVAQHPQGTKVQLIIADAGEFAATIAWSSDSKTGARFVEPMDEAVFQALMRCLRLSRLPAQRTDFDDLGLIVVFPTPSQTL